LVNIAIQRRSKCDAGQQKSCDAKDGAAHADDVTTEYRAAEERSADCAQQRTVVSTTQNYLSLELLQLLLTLPCTAGQSAMTVSLLELFMLT
jgi:hypothetical protein